MANELYDVVIVGGGPGGLTAGIYAKRAALDTVLIEKGVPGGQVAVTPTVDGNRLRILLYISRERKSVSDIVHELNLSQPLVSHHLKELKHALLVEVQREGPFVYYQISDPGILELVDSLSEMATNLLSAKRNF